MFYILILLRFNLHKYIYIYIYNYIFRKLKKIFFLEHKLFSIFGGYSYFWYIWGGLGPRGCPRGPPGTKFYKIVYCCLIDCVYFYCLDINWGLWTPGPPDFFRSIKFGLAKGSKEFFRNLRILGWPEFSWKIFSVFYYLCVIHYLFLYCK